MDQRLSVLATAPDLEAVELPALPATRVPMWNSALNVVAYVVAHRLSFGAGEISPAPVLERSRTASSTAARRGCDGGR